MQADNIIISESHLRSLAKGFSWRIWGTVISIIVSYFLTHELKIALAIGGIEFFSKIVLFYLHERIWDFITWGMRANFVTQEKIKKYIKTK